MEREKQGFEKVFPERLSGSELVKILIFYFFPAPVWLHIVSSVEELRKCPPSYHDSNCLAIKYQ